MKRIAGFMIVTSLAPMHAGVTITCNLLDTRSVQPPVGQFAVCDGVSKEGSLRMQQQNHLRAHAARVLGCRHIVSLCTSEYAQM